MLDEFQTTATKEFFGSWAKELRAEVPPVPPPEKLRPLMLAKSFQSPRELDGAQLATAQVSQTPALYRKLEGFTEDEPTARQNVQILRGMYKDIRQSLKEHKDVAALLLGAQSGGDARSIDDKLINYLVQGESVTRLNEKIALPEKGADDRPLLTLLRLIRIAAEHYMDEEFGLPWLANDEGPEATRFKLWEIKAGDLGESIGGAAGRAAAVTMSTLLGGLGGFVKLPDEVTLGVSYFMGIGLRKTAEYQMHRYLTENPEFG